MSRSCISSTAISSLTGLLFRPVFTVCICGLLLAGANRAAAAISVTFQESDDGLVISFLGTTTAPAGPSGGVTSPAPAGGLGYSLRYNTRPSANSTMQVGYSGTLQSPYYQTSRVASWSFLTITSMQGVSMGSEAAQMTVASQDNALLFFRSDATTANGPSTTIQLWSNSPNIVIDRAYTLPGVSFATLNMDASVEYDTDYALSGGDTLRFVNPEAIPEPSVALLGMLGSAGLLRRRRA